jgi:AMP-binding enzyme
VRLGSTTSGSEVLHDTSSPVWTQSVTLANAIDLILSHSDSLLAHRTGDIVATMAWNTTRHMEAWYGIMGIGAVCHTLNPRLFEKELEYIINHAGESAWLVVWRSRSLAGNSGVGAGRRRPLHTRRHHLRVSVGEPCSEAAHHPRLYHSHRSGSQSGTALSTNQGFGQLATVLVSHAIVGHRGVGSREKVLPGSDFILRRGMMQPSHGWQMRRTCRSRRCCRAVCAMRSCWRRRSRTCRSGGR